MSVAGLGGGLLLAAVVAVAVAGGDDWVWAGEGGDAVEVRASYKAQQPVARGPTDVRTSLDAPPFAPYIQRVLSAACCRDGHVFNVATTACETSLQRPSSPNHAIESNLSPRSGLTSLPPNCPPGKKFDSESNRCRDVWNGDES